jgi:predicted enzyme related to lactoylglutathione lyase
MEAAMKEITAHAPGNFCWVELGTTDTEAAKKFYSALFAWGINDTPAGPEGVYTLLRIKDKDVAALYQLNEQQKSQGVPPHWLLYIAVADADESVKTAVALGGKTLLEPFDVMDLGRMALLQDPTGAAFALWQARKHIGVQLNNQPNTLCWSELATTNTDDAAAFYTKLFGWSTKAGDAAPDMYTEFINGGIPIGGMLQMPAEWGNVPSHWAPYFQVTDCDATVKQAQALGATIRVPPTDIPNVGRFAVIQDAQGAHFSIIKLDHPI